MARFRDPDDSEIQEWHEWLESRPLDIREIAKRFEPWGLYRMKSTGHRVTIYSLEKQEDGRISLKVNVMGEFNAVAFERQVFGVDPNDLEPCELPSEQEELGAALTEESDVRDYIDFIRPRITGDEA